MDRKSIIILVVCFAAMLLWQPLVLNKFYPPKKPAPGATNTVPVTAAQPQTNVPAVPQPGVADATPTFTNAAAPTAMVTEDLKENLLEFQTPHVHYTFSSRGGGLKAVELLDYKEQVPRKRGQKASKDVATLNVPSRFPALSILGVDDLAQGNYELRKTSRSVQAQTALTNGLVLVKEFTPGSNYLVAVTVRLENRSEQPITLPQQEWITGTATPLSPQDDGSAVGAMWFNGESAKDVNAGWFANATLGCIPGTPRLEYTGGESNVFWTAAHNQFFALAVMAKEPAQRLVIRRLDLQVPTAEELRVDSRLNKKPYGYEVAMVYPPVTLAPGASFERNLTIFAGPKEYRTLAAIAGGANNEIDAVMGFGGFFGFFSKGLLLGMNWLHHSMKLSYGWAIIAITIIIKILFWPLTRASTRSMKRMAALQPQMKEIQQKYKDDPAKMNRKTMEFMKENKVSPLGGCLPMLLQMPVFIGFFYMIRSAIELRGAPFLWVADLSRPDTLFMIPGINFPFNLLPLLMGATMLWQAHLTPPSPGMDPMQAKIMKYMPLMFMVFLYNFSAGLTLYWTVQNLLTILQTKLTKEKPAEPAAAPQPARPPQKKRK
jgi:YidC/Oxa1 family membrane protein insertase